MVKKNGISAIFATGPYGSGATTFMGLLDDLLFKKRSGGRVSRVSISGIIRCTAAKHDSLGKQMRISLEDTPKGVALPGALVMQAIDAWLADEQKLTQRMRIERQLYLISRAPINVDQLSLLGKFVSPTVMYIEPDPSLKHRYHEDCRWNEGLKAVAKSAFLLRNSGLLLDLDRKTSLTGRLKKALDHLSYCEMPIDPKDIEHGLKRLRNQEDPIHAKIREIESVMV